MIYITGDKHADFRTVYEFINKINTSKEDILIVLGDAGINYHLDDRDEFLKKSLKECNITFFCIHGNHEERPENIDSYKTKTFHNGLVFYEEEYPNILFAKDGEIYDFDGNKVLVIGGAYSVDKDFRLAMGYKWYKSEQPSYETKNYIKDLIKKNKIDIVLSHTCPYKYIPREMFLSGINQNKVDNSTEYFLGEIEESISYKKWYCGHYHTDKKIDNIVFMFNDIELFDK